MSAFCTNSHAASFGNGGRKIKRNFNTRHITKKKIRSTNVKKKKKGEFLFFFPSLFLVPIVMYKK